MRHCEKCGKELYDDEICDCEIEIINDNKPINKPPYQSTNRGRWKIILTAVIYPAIAMGISASVMNSPLGLILAILMNVLGAFCVYIGGFTLIIIPLPFISLYWVNCYNHHIKLWKRILLGLGSIILIVGSIFVALYL